MVDRITPATTAGRHRGRRRTDRPGRRRARRHRAVHRMGAVRASSPAADRHGTTPAPGSSTTSPRSRNANSGCSTGPLPARLRRQRPRPPDHRRGRHRPGLPGLDDPVVGGGLRSPHPPGAGGRRLPGRPAASGSPTRGSGTCSLRSPPTDRRSSRSGSCPPSGRERAQGRLPIGALRVIAAWVNHLRGAGAPVKDAAAEQVVALAIGPLDDAVRARPRLLGRRPGRRRPPSSPPSSDLSTQLTVD